MPPGDSALIFAPGIIGTGMYTRDIAISPSGDELYYGISLGGYTYTTILVCRRINGRWTGPEIAPWCTDPHTMYLEPALGMKDTYGGADYYIVFRDVNDNWSEPQNMGPTVNSSAMREWSVYVSRDGEYIFFMSDRTEDIRAEKWDYMAIKSLHNSPANGNACIYWVSAEIVDELRETAVFSEHMRD